MSDPQTGQVHLPNNYPADIAEELRGIRIALENIAAELLSARRYK